MLYFQTIKKIVFFMILTVVPIEFSEAITVNMADHRLQLPPLLRFYEKVGITPADFMVATQKNLPTPYDILLTKQLMTIGIQHYYQRTPQIRKPLYQFHDQQHSMYSRAIVMIIDHSKHRDNALIADQRNESIIVELGLITINLKALPPSLITPVLQNTIPFGALLAHHHIEVDNKNRRYFKINCNPILAQLLQCQPNQSLYGRLNTLVRHDNHQWVAHVIEILTGHI